MFSTKKFYRAGLVIFAFVLGGLSAQSNYSPVNVIRFVRGKFFDKGNTFSPAVSKTEAREEIFKQFSPHADIVMVGDSLTNEGEWSEMFPGTKIANRGILYETTADVLRRIPSILSVSPKKAFIMLGNNDVGLGLNVDVIMKNYSEIVNRLRGAGIEVYIQSTIECNRSFDYDRLQSIRVLNSRLRTYAAEQKLTYVDLNKYLASDNAGLLPEYTYDGQHLRGIAYQRWKNAINPFVTDS